MGPQHGAPAAELQSVSGRGVEGAEISGEAEIPLRANGNVRMRFPVAANTAFAMAGSTGGRAGSPSPVGGYSVMRQNSSICGAWRRRSNG